MGVMIRVSPIAATAVRYYVGASATDERWLDLLTSAAADGRPVRVLVDEESRPTLDLMTAVSQMAVAGELTVAWTLNLPLWVEASVHPTIAPESTDGTHGKRVPDTSVEGLPAPASPAAGAGTIANTEEVAP